jgi:tetratricopeptide (TPR) repeat protein
LYKLNKAHSNKPSVNTAKKGFFATSIFILYFTCAPKSDQNIKMKVSFILLLFVTQTLTIRAQQDAGYYVKQFNYYFEQSQKSMLHIGPTKGKNAFELSDSTGKKAGYISESETFDPVMIDSAMYFIDEGIKYYPTRLDMRFGKVYVYQRTKNFDRFSQEINKTIDVSDSIQYKWLWKDGNLLEDSVEFFLGTIQQYIQELYQEGDEYLPLMRSISERVLKYHPNDVRFLSDISITYSLTGEYQKAMEYLLKAEHVAPHDFIILNNIAMNYRYLGDTPNAIKYYELMLKYGDEQAQNEARQKLKELKKK